MTFELYHVLLSRLLQELLLQSLIAFRSADSERNVHPTATFPVYSAATAKIVISINRHYHSYRLTKLYTLTDGV